MKKLIFFLLIITNIVFWLGYLIIVDRMKVDLNNNVKKYNYQEVNFSYDAKVIEAANKLFLDDTRVDKIAKEMSLEQKVSQLFFVSPPSDYLSEIDLQFFEKNSVGGVYFGPRNISSEGALRSLIEALDPKLKTKAFYSTDQEGASVIRLWWDQSLAGPFYLSTNDTPIVAYYYGKVRTDAFRAVGLNFNFAPVMDLQYDGSYLYLRSLSYDAKKVSKLGGEIIKGQQDGGVITAMKYFPGTGSSKVDPKKSLTEINLDKSELAFADILPFKENFSIADAIITSHAKYPKIDSENQVTFSKIFITNILKEEYGYKGLIITDDLSSASITDGTKYKKAFIAGHDMLLSSAPLGEIEDGIKSIIDAVNAGELTEDRVFESVFKIIKFKQKYSLLK